MILQHSALSVAQGAPEDAIHSVHEQFEARTAEAPGRPAIVTAAGLVSYGELNDRANAIAHALLCTANTTDKIIALLADRSVATIAGLLGIMKAGRGYLALDPEYPPNRLQLLIKDSDAPLLASSQDHSPGGTRAAARLIDLGQLTVGAVDNPGVPVAPSDLAYVAYTSGSTGIPKGALLNHGGLTRLIDFTRMQMEIGPGDRILQFASLSFDASVWETFCALTSGAALVLGDRDSLAPGPGLYRLIRDLNVTIALLSPSVLSVLPSSGLDGLRIVVAGTEKCSEEIARRWGRGRRFFNAYGPTETTVYSTIYELQTDASGPPPIGQAIPGTGTHILDGDLREVPPGESGELCISGEGVARGYLNRPDLTASRFVVAAALGGRRIYRTGDRCRQLPSGDIEYLGRLDRQVKIRGFRIEPGEIEAALEQQRGVSAAAVVPGRGPSGLVELWAYVVAEAGSTLESARLLAALAAQLPRYMLPSSLQILREWPLTPNRKVDLAALPPPLVRSRDPRGGTAPLSGDAIETAVGRACATVQAGAVTGPDTSIFDLGFSSLDVARLLWEIQNNLGVALTYSAVFKAATISGIADLVRDADHPTPSALCTQAAPLAVARTRTPPESAISRTSVVRPASIVQRDLYLFGVMAGPAGLAITDYLTVPHPLDSDRFRKALWALLARHELLRTAFDEEAGRVIQRLEDVAEVPIRWLSTDVPVSSDLVEFDAAVPPLLRLTVGAAGRDSFRVRVDLSHLVADGASMEIVKRDLVALYLDEHLPDLPLTYGDYTLWQAQIAEENALSEAGAYWAGELEKGWTPLTLGSTPGAGLRERGQTVVLTSRLAAPLSQALEDFARARRMTVMMVMTGAYLMVLHALTGNRDITVGSVISGRRFSELVDVVGPFLSLVPLRVTVTAEQSIDTFFGTVREKVLNGFAYQDFDFSALYRRLAPAIGGLPFNVGFTMHTVRNQTTLDTYRQMTWPLDLNLEAIAHEGSLELHWISRRDAVSSDVIAALRSSIERAVVSLTMRPEDRLSAHIARLGKA
jgi:amino acid adenylation domain-containing protein